MTLTDDIDAPVLTTREALTLREIIATPTDSPLVISWYIPNVGQSYAPCLREPGMKRTEVKLTVYCPWKQVIRIRLYWDDTTHQITDGKFVYTVTRPVGKELASCWRVLGRYESIIMGE